MSPRRSRADDHGAVDPTRLRASLERRFRTETTAFPVAGDSIELLHPASAEELIDEADFERDERLPYWADVWPSARVLATLVRSRDGRGQSLLELGCGAGLAATAAALAGFTVTATDYYDDALRFTAVNVAHALAGVGDAAAPPLATRLVDWRDFPGDLGRFDWVVASDVLYERPYGALVAQAIARTLAPEGVAWLTDPGRLAVESFLAECRTLGLRAGKADRFPFEEGAVRQTIDLYEARWR